MFFVAITNAILLNKGLAEFEAMLLAQKRSFFESVTHGSGSELLRSAKVYDSNLCRHPSCSQPSLFDVMSSWRNIPGTTDASLQIDIDRIWQIRTDMDRDRDE